MQSMPTPAGRVCVGLSGGPDSMALALLLQQWGPFLGIEPVAVSIDHGLRPESSSELDAVSGTLASKAIAHVILPLQWDDGLPELSALQTAARAQRRAALTEWCRKTGVQSLFLGHHADDQAETFLMRLGRGSGLSGMSGIPQHTLDVHGLGIYRPLLQFPKQRLIATCQAAGVPFVSDPSNDNDSFDRVRVRQVCAAAAGASPRCCSGSPAHLLAPLAPLPPPQLLASNSAGLTASAVNQAAEFVRPAVHAHDDAMAELLHQRMYMHRPLGYCELRAEAMVASDTPKRVKVAALSRLLAHIGGREHPARIPATARAWNELEALLAKLSSLRSAVKRAAPGPPKRAAEKALVAAMSTKITAGGSMLACLPPKPSTGAGAAKPTPAAKKTRFSSPVMTDPFVVLVAPENSKDAAILQPSKPAPTVTVNDPIGTAGALGRFHITVQYAAEPQQAQMKGADPAGLPGDQLAAAVAEVCALTGAQNPVLQAQARMSSSPGVDTDVPAPLRQLRVLQLQQLGWTELQRLHPMLRGQKKVIPGLVRPGWPLLCRGDLDPQDPLVQWTALCHHTFAEDDMARASSRKARMMAQLDAVGADFARLVQMHPVSRRAAAATVVAAQAVVSMPFLRFPLVPGLHAHFEWAPALPLLPHAGVYIK